MIKMAHIAPNKAMKQAEEASDINLVLAHLIGDNDYTEFYENSAKVTILDNGAFEKGEPYKPETLVDLGIMVDADYIVLPDYPGKDWFVTLEAAKTYIPLFKEMEFKTFFVPQSLKGDFEGYMTALMWGLNNPDVDMVGISILGAPNALPYMDRNKTRAYILAEIEMRLGSLLHKDKIHMLGKLDTVDEITSWKPFEHMINSHDTSAAVWYGMNDISVQNRTEKFAVAVDFDIDIDYNHSLVEDNMTYMKGLLT